MPTRNLTRGRWPFWAAMKSGVAPSRMQASTSAPAPAECLRGGAREEEEGEETVPDELLGDVEVAALGGDGERRPALLAAEVHGCALVVQPELMKMLMVVTLQFMYFEESPNFNAEISFQHYRARIR